jgi:hypothetical protein
VSTHFPFSPDSDDPLQNEYLQQVAGELEYVVTELEPRARHLNRRFIDVFGAHPSSVDGSWVFIDDHGDGTYSLGFEHLDVRHAFRLEGHLDAITDLVDEAGIHPCFPRTPAIDPGVQIVGDAARLRNIPTIHVRIERRA